MVVIMDGSQVLDRNTTIPVPGLVGKEPGIFCPYQNRGIVIVTEKIALTKELVSLPTHWVPTV